LESGERHSAKTAKHLLILGALGVVFGDIGTSPLYALPTLFSPDDPHPIAFSHDTLFGVVSLIFWTVMLIVTVTYVMFVMRADNHGQGGIMALVSRLLGRSARGTARTKMLLVSFGLFGAALFFGDSMITPAISVLSAVEGIEVVAPQAHSFIIPITATVIIALFTVQRFGTHVVGRAFGPVMLVWFIVLALLGLDGISKHPQILQALSPTWAASFILDSPSIAFFALGSVVLAVTGAEALYADMGHFGRSPIVWGWVALVLPSLTLNYMGQGALMLSDPSTVHSVPFFHLGPEWSRYPVLVLATIATVIASQAVITGAYSVVHQAMRLGFLPRLRVLHTSEQTIGQIYVPWINWALMAAVLILIFAFRDSSRLAFAYGVAVTGTIAATTTLFMYFARQQWRVPLPVVLIGGGLLVGIDLLLFSANVIKIFHGAWLPLVVGGLLFVVMVTWKRGIGVVARRRARLADPLDEFIQSIDRRVPPIPRTEGTAVFLDRDPNATPLAMRALVKHLRVLPEQTIVLTIDTADVPHLDPSESLSFVRLGEQDGIVRVRATYGYMDTPDVQRVMRAIDESGKLSFRVSPYHSTYYLSHVELHKGERSEMQRWQRAVFIASSRISSDPAAYFRLPPERAVILGSNLEL
jgi:KUP system potassium uptake protein